MKSIKYLILLTSALGGSTAQPMGAFKWTADKFQTTRINWAIDRSDASFIESCNFTQYSADQLTAFSERAQIVKNNRSTDKINNKNNTYSVAHLLKASVTGGFAFIAGTMLVELMPEVAMKFAQLPQKMLEIIRLKRALNELQYLTITDDNYYDILEIEEEKEIEFIEVKKEIKIYIPLAILTVAFLYLPYKAGTSAAQDLFKSYNYKQYTENKFDQAQKIETTLNNVIQAKSN